MNEDVPVCYNSVVFSDIFFATFAKTGNRFFTVCVCACLRACLCVYFGCIKWMTKTFNSFSEKIVCRKIQD